MSQQLCQTTAAAATPRAIHYTAPRVDIHREGDDYILEADVPGVGKDGVEITFEAGRLTITGRRTVRGGDRRAVYSEIEHSDYRRVFDVDPSIDAGGITATVEAGVLAVRLPKAEASKARKIPVG